MNEIPMDRPIKGVLAFFFAAVAGITLSSCEHSPASNAITSAEQNDYQPVYQLVLRKAETSPEAMGVAGFLNLIGAGTPQDVNKGLRMLQSATDQGSSAGYFGLGFAYSYGLGVPVDAREAARYYSAVGGMICEDPRDQPTSLDILATAETKIRGFCGTPVDPRSGFADYQSIEDSLSIVSVILGRLYSDGTGTPKDLSKATAYFHKAVVAGLTFADASLGDVADAETKPSTTFNSQDPGTALSLVATGTAFAINQEGSYLTNYHVVRGCKSLLLNSVPATVVHFDESDDLALLTSSYRSPVAAVFRGPVDGRAGETVVAIGFPLSGLLADQANVTTGTVSATAGIGNDQRYLQITAPVQPGNSGGPLLDNGGLVIGVVAAKLDALKIATATGDIPENVNFSIKTSIVRAFLAAYSVPTNVAKNQKPLEIADIAANAQRYTYLVQCFD
jgi:S1-C subfamily serine protease